MGVDQPFLSITTFDFTPPRVQASPESENIPSRPGDANGEAPAAERPPAGTINNEEPWNDNKTQRTSKVKFLRRVICL